MGVIYCRAMGPSHDIYTRFLAKVYGANAYKYPTRVLDVRGTVYSVYWPRSEYTLDWY